MYAVAFKSQDKQLDLSVVGDAGYALILPWMPVPVSMITLTQVVSGTSTVVARAAIGREIPDLKHLALTVDGMQAKVYFRGRLLMVGTLSTTMTIDRVELQGGTKDTLLSEMLLMPRVAEPEDIAMWHNLRAPFYDPSPHIPAEHQPVTVKGAGADIDIDKFGIRATRKADGKKTFEIDAETGDVHFEGDGVFRGRVEASEGYFHGRVEAEEGYFRGDITGATGTFSGEVRSIDSAGNYSVLDQARLRFYRRIGNETTLSYYVAQIATGEAVDGQVVNLADLGYRFFERPKIVLQPKMNRVFVANTTSQDVWMDWDVENETFDSETGAASFKVRARTIIKGATTSGSFSPNRLTVEGTSTTTTTGPGTTFLSFKVGGYSWRNSLLFNSRLEFSIHYRTIGSSTWTLLASPKYERWGHLDVLDTLTYSVPHSGAQGYQVRITLDLLDDAITNRREEQYFRIYEFFSRSSDTILSDPANPEIVSWIAIDGG